MQSRPTNAVPIRSSAKTFFLGKLKLVMLQFGANLVSTAVNICTERLYLTF